MALFQPSKDIVRDKKGNRFDIKDLFLEAREELDFDSTQDFLEEDEFVKMFIQNDVKKIVQYIFSRPFRGSDDIKKHLFSSVFGDGELSFYDVTLEVLLEGKSDFYLVDNSELSFESKLQIDEKGEFLRGKEVHFGGFLKNLPQDISTDKVDKALKISLDITKNGQKGAYELLKPMYKTLYSLYCNLNYALKVANTPQIKLNQYRELALAQANASSSSKIFSMDFLKSHLNQLKEAFHHGGRGKRAVYMDGGDSISFEMPSVDNYEKAYGLLQKKIANLLNLPISYLFGQSPTGFNATGEKDFFQFHSTCESWYALVVKPLFDRVSDLFSLDAKSSFNFKDPLKEAKGIEFISKHLDSLKQLKSDGFMDEEELKNLVKSYIK